MDKDLSSTVTTTVVHSSSSSSSSYMMMSSPSCCFPIQNEFQYSRIHHFSNTCSCCCCCSSSSTMKRRRGWRWRSILRRLMRESKTTLMCRSNKPVSFQYDPVSYSHNFDEGSFHLHHHHQEPSQLVFQDHSGAVFHRLDSHCKI
ncbi:uncharacterized protein LOC107641607 [Arachis ipaensis]|uniref:uncharacterized protein LOC107641607 n=1 Tax=Arachis ipaensis TaxID=130454 RepID=UPI0007AFA1C9|nr:uncharacterized protein LOC107641607 [Arachis ipaensis]